MISMFIIIAAIVAGILLDGLLIMAVVYSYRFLRRISPVKAAKEVANRLVKR